MRRVGLSMRYRGRRESLKGYKADIRNPAAQPGRRKIADAIMEAAKFKPTVDGKRLVRQYEVHGIAVTEWLDAEKALGAPSLKK